MSLSISSSYSAIAPGVTTYFLGLGGVEPYVYSLAPGGAGGTINSETGEYTAPIGYGTETIIVTDDDAATAQTTILISSPLQLVCNIIQNQMQLEDDQIFIWGQKYNIPNDSRPYIAVGISSAKPFGSNLAFQSVDDDTLQGKQSINMKAEITIDIMSRDFAAVERKEELILALGSNYSQAQQELNTFYVSRLPHSFVNIPKVEGAAILYRYNLKFNMQYFVRVLKQVEFFDDFDPVEVTTEP